MVINPPWTREELILATDLIARNGWRSSIGDRDERLLELSALLRAAPFHDESERDERFRGPGSVRRKYSNIYSRHPEWTGPPTHGGRLDQEVLDAYLADPEGMASEAARLRIDILNSARRGAAGSAVATRSSAGGTRTDGGGEENRSVTRESLGAWVLKCNPDIYDLPSRMMHGDGRIDGGWSVQGNYRSEMMKPGDHVLLWVTGSKFDLPRGIWGVGRIVGEREAAGTPGAESGDWLDEDRRLAVQYFIPEEIKLLDEPVTNADLVAAGITDLEVQRIAQVGNPSYVTMDQWQRIHSLLDDEAEPGPEDERVVVKQGGAGFGTPLQNRAVELAAMAAVSASYPAAEWSRRDVSKDNCGWDITFRRRTDGLEHKVEVKGVSGSRPIILLTANEYRTAEVDPVWLLAVVTRAMTDTPKVRTFSAENVIRSAKAFVHRVDLSGTRT